MKTVNQKKTIKFTCFASKIDNTSLEQFKISEASLEIKGIKGENVISGQNLTLFKAPLANGGLINKNGHGIAIPDLVKTYKKFANTPVNVEHNRANTIGFIIKSYLTNHQTDEILTEEQALESTKPIDVCIVFATWPHVDPSLSTILEEVGNPENPSYGLISLSWECAFSSYNLLLGSYNVSEGQVIEDENEINELEKYLIDNGGTGYTEDGKSVSMIIADGESILPLGCGLVVHPAARVKGVIKINDNITEGKVIKEDDTNLLTETVLKLSENVERLLNNNKNNKEIQNLGSHITKSSVLNKSMKTITSVSEITDESIKEITASEIVRFIAEELGKKSAEHVEAVAVKEAELTVAKNNADSALKKVDELTLNLENVSKELNDMKMAQATQKADNDFNIRMTGLNEEFELDDEDRKVIANQIKDLNEDDFASWKTSFDVLAKQKNKEWIKTKTKVEEKPEGKKESKASDETKVETDPLDEIKAKAGQVVPGSVTFSEDKLAAYRNAFAVDKVLTIK